MVTIELVEEHHRTKIGWLCRNLSSRDHAEVYSVQFAEDPDLLTEKIMISKGFTWIACLDDGEPVAIYGASCLWPNVWQAFAFGTDKYHQVIISLTRHCRQFIIPALRNHGVRMVHCWVKADYQEARQWIRMAFPGAEEEAIVADFGKDGEAFALMTWRPQGSVRALALMAAE